MAKVLLNWKINRFLQAQEAAATVPSHIRGLLEQPGIHTSNRVFVLEKIAGLIEAGAEKMSIVSSVNHPIAARLYSGELKISPLADAPISTRPNILLFSDSTANEAIAMLNEPNCWRAISLRIGFLNGDLGKLPEFLTAFDIVIADEQGLNLSMRMIEEIVATKTRGTSGEKAIEK
ncbi:hypothetical protein PRIPAC_81095 [Pristionchus pacificus]|uniref:Uncharacterized protein n=1 Tax=Pristionchus pacificus TaxID=54126 RepID=A0A2A6CNJ2_PRIPA|nr:hypothetical protein PRIPAC_81095 [Pristionchus pacificus]|eukprot:PDM79601.1 hypothetical protein PRIPAC_32180 [Pristionchus pacificus]